MELDLKWSLLMHLFSSEENLKLLNTTAPSFFKIVQELFIADVVMGISRLMDPPAMGKNENLSMASLRIVDIKTQAIYAKILQNIVPQCRAISTWRRKKLAHNDLKFALRLSRLPRLHLAKIDRIIALLFDAVNTVGAAMKLHPIARGMIYLPGGPEALLQVLKAGTSAAQQR